MKLVDWQLLLHQVRLGRPREHFYEAWLVLLLLSQLVQLECLHETGLGLVPGMDHPLLATQFPFSFNTGAARGGWRLSPLSSSHFLGLRNFLVAFHYSLSSLRVESEGGLRKLLVRFASAVVSTSHGLVELDRGKVASRQWLVVPMKNTITFCWLR